MESTLVITQQYRSAELSNLMEAFRWMINESIRIGIERNLSSLKSLNGNLYHYLSDNMRFLKLYVARAIVVAKSKLRDFRKARKKNPDVRIPY